MRKWFVGVDGGGTKTAIMVATKLREVKAEEHISGCSYLMLGIDGAKRVIVNGIKKCLQKVNADLTECAGICIGLPCYGEEPQLDDAIRIALQEDLAPAPIYIVNDVEVGWAGALDCCSGIHVVAGTGSIAFAKNEVGQTARCGGWNELFGDEGSCYWIGREAMSVFTKEADGRLQKGALYKIVRQEFHLADDMNFINLIVNEYALRRDKVASFQHFAFQAAQEGDAEAISLYRRAACELALMVRALRNKLSFPDGTTVSYSGGLFHTGNLIILPLKEKIDALNCKLEAPKRSSVEGAWLLAVNNFDR